MPKKLIAAVATAALALLGTTVTAPALADTPSTDSSLATHVADIQAAPVSSLYAGGLYVQPDSVAAQAAQSLAAAGQTADAAAASYIAQRPVAIWLGDTLTGQTLVDTLNRNLSLAEQAGTTPVFVTYAIPDRDCGGYSGGGLSPAAYGSWNQTIASTLAGHRAVVLVEPDSLGQITTCPGVDPTRLDLLRQAVQQFAAADVPAYLDGGNSRWLKPAQMASLLNEADVADARGFFTNVANYSSVTDERSYADQISALTGGSHYVIDVGRNGQGWKGTWCNAIGAGLGQDPHVTYGDTKLDALLWVKTPGASDGPCNGGPAAGDWFASYADALVALKK